MANASAQRTSERRTTLNNQLTRTPPDHLLHVPNAQPPLPSDWEVHPTYPVHNNIPYYLAPLWDAGIRHRAEERVAAKKLKAKSASHSKSKAKSAAPVKDAEIKAAEESVEVEGKGKVPQELRAKMKKARGAKTLLQELELEIRNFVRDWEIAYSPTKPSSRPMTPDQDSEDEDIVFIGRKALASPGRISALDTPDGVAISMSDEAKEVMEEELKREMRVYEGLKGSKEGGFARWLVHSLAEYYGLGSRSVDVGGRREAWVCVREVGGVSGVEGLRPLWGLV